MYGLLFGLMIIIAIYAALGFLLAWISNMITSDEMEIKTGVIILVIAGIINIALQYGLGADFPAIGGAGVNLVTLAGMIWLIGKVAFLKSLIIAAIFSAVIFVITLALASMAA